MAKSTRNERFLELIEQHHAQIFGFVHALTCHREDAEDVMQQAMLTMWQQFDRFQSGTNFPAWACTIARNAALNHFQSKKRNQIFSTAMMNLLEVAQAEQESSEPLRRRQALRSCMKKLRDEDRRLLLMCYEGGSDIKTVSSRLQRPAASVYNSLSRVRRALYRCIEATMAQGEAR